MTTMQKTDLDRVWMHVRGPFDVGPRHDCMGLRYLPLWQGLRASDPGHWADTVVMRAEARYQASEAAIDLTLASPTPNNGSASLWRFVDAIDAHSVGYG